MILHPGILWSVSKFTQPRNVSTLCQTLKQHLGPYGGTSVSLMYLSRAHLLEYLLTALSTNFLKSSLPNQEKKTRLPHSLRLRLKSIVKLVGVDTDETDVGGDKDSMEGGQPDSIDEYLEKTLDEDAAAAAAAADVKRRLEFESPSAVRVEESDGGSGEGNSAKDEG